jgi:hypothetical protein
MTPEPLPLLRIDEAANRVGLKQAAIRRGVARGELPATKALADGDFKLTKNEKVRAVDLLAPLSVDLAEWKLANGRPAGDALVFPSATGANGAATTGRTGTARVQAVGSASRPPSITAVRPTACVSARF